MSTIAGTRLTRGKKREKNFHVLMKLPKILGLILIVCL